jgi:hypothetical protein
MRKVVANLFISLDGVVEAPETWQFEFDDDMAADEPFASHINATPKYVASTTLKEVEWQSSSLLGGDLAAGVGRLKQEPGRNIGTAGSPGLVRSLLAQGLVDARRTSSGVMILAYRPSSA